MLPFKTGAFYIACQTGLPIVPIVISNLYKKVKLNRLNNGKIIIEVLPPVNINTLKTNSHRETANYFHKEIEKKFNNLNDEICKLNKF